jgi:hypothetical protein
MRNHNSLAPCTSPSLSSPQIQPNLGPGRLSYCFLCPAGRIREHLVFQLATSVAWQASVRLVLLHVADDQPQAWAQISTWRRTDLLYHGFTLADPSLARLPILVVTGATSESVPGSCSSYPLIHVAYFRFWHAHDSLEISRSVAVAVDPNPCDFKTQIPPPPQSPPWVARFGRHAAASPRESTADPAQIFVSTIPKAPRNVVSDIGSSSNPLGCSSMR